MGKRKQNSRRRSSSSSSSSSDTSGDRMNKGVKKRVKMDDDGGRSYTPPPRTPGNLNSGLIDLVNMIKNVKQPGLGISVRDVDITDFNPMFHNIDEWISKIEEYSNIYKWSDTNICHLAVNKLKGPAEVWYKSLQSIPKSWFEWKTLLVAAFPSTRDLHSLMTEMISFKPKVNQSLYEYCFEKLSLIRKMNLNLSGSDEVNLIVGSLDNQNVKFAVKAAGITDPSKLAVYLQSFEPGTFSANVQKDLTRVLPLKKPLISDTIDKQKKNGRCYKCKQVGHKQYHCPQNNTQGDRSKLHCNYCRNKGHTIENCFKKLRKDQNNRNQAGPSTSRDDKQVLFISRDGDKNKFYKPAVINDNIKVQCFIDFGSECSLVTEGLARESNLKIVPLSRPITLTVFGGSEIEVFSKVSCQICVDSVCLPLELLVVEKCIPGVEVVIGQNFTEDPEIKYMRAGQSLLFTRASLSINAIGATQKFSEQRVIKVGVRDSEVQRRIQTIVDDFPVCFPGQNAKLGCIRGVEMTIKLKTDTPVVQRPYRLAESEKAVLRELIEGLLQDGTIRPSQSPFASPVIMVKKKTGQSRLCVDYRAINKQSVKETYPLPVIEELIDRLAGQKFFTSLDCRSGYHQIRLTEESISVTAFVTPEGKYEYLKVPFGLTNAPYVFQRAMDQILGDLRFSKVLLYLDDILIPATTIDENLETLQLVLGRLEENGVSLNLEKCHFLTEEIEYLGYIVENGQVKPSPNKISAIEKFPVPKDVHQIRQFLGLVGHFRKFVPNFAQQSKPLTTLLKKGKQWVWANEQQNSYDHLKGFMVSTPILTLFDSRKEIILYTDASRIGLAGMLVQVEDGSERVVGYYSKTTTPTEQRYHSFELETLAIVRSVKRFRHYLIGISFKIYTDCSAVKSALMRRDLNRRIGRWVLDLQEYDFQILHRPGARMCHVDALSRNPVADKTKGVYAMVISEHDWLLASQEADKDICSVKVILQSGERHSNKSTFNDYELRRGLVYRRTEHGSRVVLPKACRWQVLRHNHDDIGHFAFDKTFERVSASFWFPKMRKFIQKYVGACINCMYHKIPSGKRPGFLHPVPKIPRPFHTIHIDHLGPFCKSKQGNNHVIVIVDAFTKFCFIKAVKNTKTKYVVEELGNIIKVFGVPKRIITDRGKAFTSKTFKGFCEERQVQLHFNAVGMPRGNGQVERYNKTVLDSLATMGATNGDDEWDQNITNIQLGINNTLNKAIATTPAEALVGYRSGPQNIGFVESEKLVDVLKLRKTIKEKVESTQQRQKANFDLHRANPKPFGVGDLVLVKISSIVSTGKSRKLVPKWKGPFKISKILESDRYEVNDIPGSSRSRVPYTGVYAAEQIKKWTTFDAPE